MSNRPFTIVFSFKAASAPPALNDRSPLQRWNERHKQITTNEWDVQMHSFSFLVRVWIIYHIFILDLYCILFSRSMHTVASYWSGHKTSILHLASLRIPYCSKIQLQGWSNEYLVLPLFPDQCHCGYVGANKEMPITTLLAKPQRWWWLISLCPREPVPVKVFPQSYEIMLNESQWHREVSTENSRHSGGAI
jgi:hypothetical protein